MSQKMSQNVTNALLKYTFERVFFLFQLSNCTSVIWKVIYLFSIFVKWTPEKYTFSVVVVMAKALQNWKISVKALTKRLWKLTIKMKRLWRLKLLSFVNVNN